MHKYIKDWINELKPQLLYILFYRVISTCYKAIPN